MKDDVKRKAERIINSAGMLSQLIDMELFDWLDDIIGNAKGIIEDIEKAPAGTDAKQNILD